MAPKVSQNGERSILRTVRGNQPAASSLPGTRLTDPAAQGDYDGLCGLYCIINAVKLVMAPHRELRHDEARSLFAVGVRFLLQRGGLPKAVHSCVRPRDWPGLAERIVASTQRIAGFPIVLDRPRLSANAPFEATLSHVERMITAGMAPCVFLRGSYRHYSVISGYTPASLLLFDSFSYHWVRRRSCGTTATHTSLHRFHVQSIITLAAGSP